MRMKLKIVCLRLVFLGWMLANGMISCKLSAANGPTRISGAGWMSNVVLKLQAFGIPVIRTVVGKVNAKSFWQTGHCQASVPKFLLVVLCAMATVLPVLSLMRAQSPPDLEPPPEDLEAPTLPSAHDIREVDFASLHSSRPHIDDDHMLCQHVLGLPPPWLEIQGGTMPTDDDDFADELPSPTAALAVYRKSPMVVGMLGMRNSLIPALHSLEPWQRLDPCSLNISCPWPCTLRGHRSI